MKSDNILEDYKKEPIYIFGTAVLEIINEKIEKATIACNDANLKVRLIGEAKKRELTILHYQIIDEYHKICKEEGLEDNDDD